MEPMENQPIETQPAGPDLSALGVRLYRDYVEAKRFFEPALKKAREHRDFYDADQWTDAQKQELRLQGRPPVVINSIFKAINNVSGKQRDARLDYKALPMGKDDILAAHLATRGLDYIEEANKTQFTESEVFLEALKGPLGWAKVVYDDTDPTCEEVQVHLKSFEEVLYDPFGKKKDLTDFRHLIELRDVDLEVAESEHPDHVETLRALARERQDKEGREGMLGDYDNRDDGERHEGHIGELPGEEGARPRVLLREHHYWEMEETQYLRLPNGDKVDAEDPRADEFILQGAQMHQGKKKCFYYAIMAGKAVLHHAKTNYPFARFPYAALWAFKTRKGIPYGLIENMVWPQKERNVARARVNESMRSRYAMVKKGSLTPGELDKLAKNLSRANFVQEVADPSAVVIGDDKSDVMAWLQIESNAANEIDDVAGLNEAAYGDKSNEKSGKAIDARVRQQSLNLGELFDNWKLWRLLIGQMTLALALKQWTPEKWARVAEVTVLKEHQEAMQKALMAGEPLPPQADLSWIPRAVAGINSLLRFDIKLVDQAETTSERQAAMEQAIQLTGLLPDPAKAAIAPDIIRMSDFPGAEEMASKAEQAMMPPPMPGLPPGMPPMPPPVPPAGGIALPPEALPPVA